MKSAYSVKHLRNVSALTCLAIALTLIGCTTLKIAGASLPTATFSPSATPFSTATSFSTATPIPTPTQPTPKTTPTTLPTPTPTATDLPHPTKTPDPTICPCPPPCSCQIEHVVIISIDGLRPDVLDKADTPVIDALQANGAYSPRAQAVLPSVTLINHASMLSGMSPEKHGITWNEHDPALGTVNGPTLFSVAHQAGLSTAMVVGKPKLEHLVLPDTMDTYNYAGFTDRQVVNEAVKVIEAGLPNVLFIHLPDVDSAGHLTGWMSRGQLFAVSMTDDQVGKVVAALDTEQYLDKTLLIITADHGGSDTSHGSDSPEDITVPWLAVGPGVSVGVVLESNIIMYDTAATALYALNLPVPKVWEGQPTQEIFVTSDE